MIPCLYMLTFFEAILVGHLIGDYMAQNKWMAYKKGTGYFACFVHCVIYTLCVCVATTFNPYWILVVFLSHFPVDKFSLADKWLALINGRSLTDFMAKGKHGIPEYLDSDNYWVLQGGFTSVAYTVVDNTFHLLLMVFGYGMLVKLHLM